MRHLNNLSYSHMISGCLPMLDFIELKQRQSDFPENIFVQKKNLFTDDGFFQVPTISQSDMSLR